MTKAQLVSRLAEGTGASRKQFDDILDSMIGGFSVASAFKDTVLGSSAKK